MVHGYVLPKASLACALPGLQGQLQQQVEGRSFVAAYYGGGGANSAGPTGPGREGRQGGTSGGGFVSDGGASGVGVGGVLLYED
jgi:hypothetical protein